MRVHSVNIGARKSVEWRGQIVETGIFKYPVDSPILLGETDVSNDSVVDRKHHGGIDKAVYAYSLNHYPFWKERFPHLDWNHGMFGENLTVDGLDECKMLVGSTYQVGEAVVQVCQPRQPCMKLGVRFGTQNILKSFVNEPYPGVYFRVLKTGDVKVDDEFQLINEEMDSPSIAEVYGLMYQRQTESVQLIERTLACAFLPESCKERVRTVQG
jgi:MOSC domain-containing protein YiiM